MAFRSLKELHQIARPFLHPSQESFLWRRILETLCDTQLPLALAQGKIPWNPTTQKRWEEILQALQIGLPWQYWQKNIPFLDLTLEIRPGVFIPRPETEWWMSKLIHLLPFAPNRIIDIGTGSGCIALSLKKAFPHAAVWGLDISPQAIRLVASNAQNLGLFLHVWQADFMKVFSAFQGPAFDLIVSNPPYIPHRYKHTVDAGVYHHEPPLALFCQDIEFYEKIFIFSQKTLTSRGILAVELFPPTADKVRKICPYNHDIIYDLAGKPRALLGYKKASYLCKSSGSSSARQSTSLGD